jgi:hypothetical protein
VGRAWFVELSRPADQQADEADSRLRRPRLIGEPTDGGRKSDAEDDANYPTRYFIEAISFDSQTHDVCTAASAF